MSLDLCRADGVRPVFRLARHPGAGLDPVSVSLGCRFDATWLACRGLPSSCRRPGYFLLLAQEKVTKEKGPPDDAPSGLRPPGARVGSGVFRQGILPWRKTGPHPCGPPCGLSSTHPPRHTGTPRAKSRSKSCRSTVGAHPVRDHPTERYIPAWRSRTGCAPTDKREGQRWGRRRKVRSPRLRRKRTSRAASSNYGLLLISGNPDSRYQCLLSWL